jgi:hypothetical protein
VYSQFGNGNIIVAAIGNSTTPLSSTTATVPVTLVEFTSSGQWVQNLLINSFSVIGCSAKSRTCTNNTLPQSFLSKSQDGRYLTMTGFATPPETSNSAILSRTSTIPRAVVRIHYSAVVDVSTTFTGFRSTVASIRSSVSVDGTGFWVAGYQDGTTLDGGIIYINFSTSTPSTNLDTGIAKSYKSAVIVGNRLFINDEQPSPCNYIEYMSPLSTIPSNIGGQQVTQTSCPQFSLGFVYINSSFLFIADYGVGLRHYISPSANFISGFIEDTAKSPVYPPPTLPDYKNMIGIEWAGVGTTLLYITTPSSLYLYDFAALTWRVLAEANAGVEFRGVAMAPSSPTASSTATSSLTATSTSSFSSGPTATATYSSEATRSASASATATQTNTASQTGSASATSSLTSTSSYTSTHTSTSSPSSTGTQTSTSSVSPLPQPQIVSQTGTIQVPPNMVQAKITMWGAGGGGSTSSSGFSSWSGMGGGGAFVTGILTVIPSETLRLIIGIGGSAIGTAASGGGSSAIQRFINNTWVDIVVAGGGGGATGYYGTPPPGFWRTAGYGGGGGLLEGCDPYYEVPTNGIINVYTLVGVGGNQTSQGIPLASCLPCPECPPYGSGGGAGWFNGAGSCKGAAGGGSSYLDNLQYTELSESAPCGSPQAGGIKNPYYSSKIAAGGQGQGTNAGKGGNGTIVIEWVWPNPFFLPPSLSASAAATPTATRSADTLSATKSYGASGSPSISMSPSTTPTPAVRAEVPQSHLACSLAPSTVSRISINCPVGSTIGFMGFMGCGIYTGTCGNYEITGCNLMTKTAQARVEAECTGKNGCSFSGAELCSAGADDDTCIGVTDFTALLQANCIASTDMLKEQALRAVQSVAGTVGETTELRYIHFNSIMSLSDGQMGFSELKIFLKDGTNVALAGTATSSSVLSASYGSYDYSICWAGPSDVASAAIDGNLCTFFAANYDAQPWWNLDLGYGIPLSEISHIELYLRGSYSNPYGATIDYSYQLDSATVTLSDGSGVPFFTGTLPWLSTISQPFTVDVSDVLAALAATTDTGVLSALGFS